MNNLDKTKEELINELLILQLENTSLKKSLGKKNSNNNPIKETGIKNEVDFYLVFNNTPVLIWLSGTDALCFYFNKPWLDFTGRTLKQEQGNGWTEGVHPDDFQSCLDIYLKAFNSRLEFSMEYRLRRADGKYRWLLDKGVPRYESNGKFIGYIGSCTDITENKRIEETLGESELKYRNLFENMPDGVYKSTYESGFVDLNPALVKMLGYSSKEELIDINTPEQLYYDISYRESILNQDNNTSLYIYCMKKKDGSVIWVEDHGWSNYDKSKNVLYHEGIIRDITDRKLAEAKISNSNNYNRSLIEASIDPMVTIGSDGKITDVNNATEKVTGIKRKYLIGSNFSNYFTESDLANKGYQQVLKSGQITDYPLTIRNANGKMIDVLYNASVYKNIAGEAQGIFAVARDITDRKLVEKHLKENEGRYKELSNLLESITDHIPGLLFYKDKKNNFIKVNKYIAEAHGKTKSELIGKNCSELYSKEDAEKYYMDDLSVINSGVSKLDFEERWETESGLKWINTSKIPFKDASGNIIGIIGISMDITKRKKAEESLQIEHEKLIKIANQVPGVVYQYKLYPDGRSCFPYASDGIKEIYRVSPEEVIEDASKVFENIHPDDLLEVAASIQKSAKELSPWQQEYRVKFKDGTINALYGNALPQLENDGSVLWYGFITDITERKLSEEKLHKLSQAVEQSPVTVVITDTEGTIEYVNPKFVETTGYSMEEVIGQNTRILKSGHTSPEEYKQLWQTLSTDGEWHGEFHNKKKNGELYWESATISPIIDAKGVITHFLAIHEDISYRKESDLLLQQKSHKIEVQNEEYKHLNEELIIAKDHAVESDRLKSSFLANMSHEIRTPMNGILGFAALLKEPMLTGKEQKEYIDIIEKSGARMLNIINDIIDISKIEAGLMKVNMIESNINDQIDYIYTFFKPEVESKGMKLFSIKSLDSTDSIIKTDREKVYAILINLVKNAIKYSDKGSIEFGYTKMGEYLEFFVKDTGIGIHENRQKVIFERFIQADINDRLAVQGAGLGLSISKAFVEMLGGKIWVESKTGIGSTFFFTIPYNTILNKETIPAKKLPKKESGNPIKKLKILIVEDDAISKLLIMKIITKISREILTASTGIKAIEICRNNPDIDLVMMDINMSDMNGNEATKQIRKFNKKVIIIAQTANAFASDKEEAIASGCNAYISKPINMDILIELLQKYFA